MKTKDDVIRTSNLGPNECSRPRRDAPYTSDATQTVQTRARDDWGNAKPVRAHRVSRQYTYRTSHRIK